MSFKLPFPTLKLLTMVQLGKAMFDKQLRSGKKFGIPSTYVSISRLNKIHVDDMVKPFQIGPALRHDFSDVLKGMHYQMKNHLIVDGFPEYDLVELEFLFDVHGKLDCPSIWRRYIHSRFLRCTSDFTPATLKLLVYWLEFALDRNSWRGIYAILSKISTAYSMNPDGACLESGKLVLVHGKYAMFYRFSNTLTTRSASHVRSRFQRLCSKSTSIEARQKGLYLSEVHFDRLFFQDYFQDAKNSMDPEEKFAFLRDTLFDEYRDPCNMRCAIDILEMLDEETARRCFVAILDMHIDEKDTFFRLLLDRCSKWPLTHLLLPLLEYAEPHLSPSIYGYLINDIASFFIPERGFFGVHYVEVLEKFWDAIPSHVKQHLRSDSGVVISLKLLSKKTPYLFVKISTELWPEKSLCE